MAAGAMTDAKPVSQCLGADKGGCFNPFLLPTPFEISQLWDRCAGTWREGSEEGPERGRIEFLEIYLLNPRAKGRRALRHTPPSFVEHQEMRDGSSSLMGDFLSHRGLEQVSGWEQREEAGPTLSKNDSIYVRAFL